MKTSVTFRWVVVLLAATLIDVVVRLWSAADFTWVLRVETVLFPVTGLALALVFRSHPRPMGIKRRLQAVAVWTFFLAGLRSGIWAAGFPVQAANLVIFVAALIVCLGYWISGGRKASKKA